MRKFLATFIIIIWLGPIFIFANEDILTLKESISIALENNASINLAREKINEARAGKGQAVSHFLPKIYSASSYTKLDEESTMSLGAGMPSVVVTEDEIYDYNLGLTQPIFHGGLVSAYKMQRENLEANQSNFEVVKNDLTFEVKRAYFKVLDTEKSKQVAEDTVGQMKAHLETVEARFGEGLIPEVEVLKTKVSLANARQNLVNADNGLELAKSSFNSLLNRNLGEEVRLEDILNFKDYDATLSVSITKALALRPEIEQMQHELNMLEGGISVARSSFYPQVSLIGNWDKKKGDEIPVDEWYESWSAVVSVELDIWDWGENLNEVRKASSKLEQLRSNFELLKDSIELEVRQAHFNFLASKEKLDLQKQAVKEAEKNYRDTLLRFKEGISTNTDVLDAQTLFTQAKTNYYKALYGCNIAIAGLERATGQR